MCICLPNGKFNFKFSRTHTCIGKKGSKDKRTLSLISESSEEDDIKDKLSSSLRSCLNKDKHQQIPEDSESNKWHIHQLCRDRQLPPVPDSGAFSALQINSPRKSVPNNNTSHSLACETRYSYQTRPKVDEYGSLDGSETYTNSKAPAQPLGNKQPRPISDTLAQEAKFPIYSQVHKADKPTAPNFENLRCAKETSDQEYLYSTIIKADFNSLRKPSRPRPSARDYPYQSMQSLHSRAPGVPLRLYKLSELSDLIIDKSTGDPEAKVGRYTPRGSKSNSLRRFSQPISASEDNGKPNQLMEGQREIDVLTRIQCQFNTPPDKRASLADMRQLHPDMETPPDSPCNSFDDPKIVLNLSCPPHPSDSSDPYQKSVSSLHSENNLQNPIPNGNPATSQRVYEGLYETLYYSSADPGRNGPQHSPPNVETTNVTTDPHIYLGHDNYISIHDTVVHPLGHDHPSAFNPRSRNSDPTTYGIYTTTGSEVYAEISDAYLSKQYEELPDPSQAGHDLGQVNSAFMGSPGTLRVLLEIQSFRHMDSDVDLSSRAATPLPRSIPALPRVADGPRLARHPWFVPQRLSLEPATSTPISGRQKPAQSLLAIMTPLMERSMEGPAMFPEDGRRREHPEDLSLSKGSSIEDENDFCGHRPRRILYPSNF